jgi:hypothetical protein
MANRVIRDGFLDSKKINAISEKEQLFFLRLMLVVDDFGRFDARPEFLRSKCYPVSNVDSSEIQIFLNTLVEIGLIKLYIVNKKQYLEIVNFDQRLRLQRSKFPEPPQNADRCPQNADRCRPESESESESESETESETESESESEQDARDGLFSAMEEKPENPKTELQETYLRFIVSGPPEWKAFTEHCKTIWIQWALNYQGLIERAITSAGNYKNYCTARYQSGQFVKRPDRWLRDEEFLIDWISKTNAAKNDKKMDSVSGREPLINHKPNFYKAPVLKLEEIANPEDVKKMADETISYLSNKFSLKKN